MTKTQEKIFTLQYKPSSTLWNLMSSKKFVRGIRGPRGSGKSSGCCHEIFDWAKNQAANADNIRKTRFAVIRNTYRELEDTTVKTWLDWFPENVFGRINKQTMTHYIILPLPDKTNMELEVLFRALDQPRDIKKLLSLELTGAYINEAREVPKGILDGLSDAVGRYPSRRDGGATQSGIIMDTNPPDDMHWWFKFEADPPYDWEFFVQPGGLHEVAGEFVPNSEAENLENLEADFYLRRAAGKDPDHIRVYYCNQFGFVKDGKPVIPEYIDAKHCLSETYKSDDSPIYIGLDFGLTPAAVFAQYSSVGRWVVFDELITEDMGAVRFAELLGQKIRGEYAKNEFEIYGDPSGDERSQVDERTPFMILAAAGIEAHRAPTNDFVIRREAIAEPLGRLAMDGEPRLLISPHCQIVRKGLAGGYHYRRLQIRGHEQYRERPTKNKYCVPLHYEILTDKGWKTVDELEHEKEKYVAYGYNWRENRIEETLIQKLNIFRTDTEVIICGTDNGTRWICTAEHRNMVKTKDGYIRYVQGKDLKEGHSFLDPFPLKKASRKSLFSREITDMTTGTSEGVWCPTTTLGNWICRAEERVFITGNSHPVDALGYLLLGAGEGRRIIESKLKPKLDLTVPRFDEELDRNSEAWMVS